LNPPKPSFASPIFAPCCVGHRVEYRFYIRETGAGPEAAFTGVRAHHFEVLRCRFRHMGSTALRLRVAVHDVRVEGNVVEDGSGNGIVVEEQSSAPEACGNQAVQEDPRRLFRNSAVRNNVVRNIGIDYRSAVGIAIGFGQNNEVTHNEIYNSPYGGVNAGWHSGGDQIVRNVTIGYNLIENTEADGMYDNGSIYTLGATAGDKTTPGYHVVGNVIRSQMNGQGPLYLDNNSSWWLAENNVIDLSRSPKWEQWGTTNPVEPIWAYVQNEANHDNVFKNNYTTTLRRSDGAKDTAWGKTTLVPWGLFWPAAARKIIANAGLEPAYADIRPTRNQLENGDFEFRQINVWKTRNAAFAQPVGDNVRGTHAVRLLACAGGAVRLRQTLRLPAAGECTVSAWVKGRAGQTVSLRLGFFTIAETTLQNDGWVQLQGKGHAAFAWNWFTVAFEGVKAGEPCYVDDCQIFCFSGK
jgi:hypothetical protein